MDDGGGGRPAGNGSLGLVRATRARIGAYR